MHGSNRLGGNSLSDLLVFGKRAGEAAAAYAAGLGDDRPRGRRGRRQGGRAGERARAVRGRGRREPVHDPAGPPADDERPGRHHPHRRRSCEAVARRDRGAQGAGEARWSSRATGSTTPAGTSRSTCATCCSSRECIAKAALERAGVPRRPHPRRLPGPDDEWGTKNLVVTLNADGTGVDLARSSRCRRCPTSCKTFFE